MGKHLESELDRLAARVAQIGDVRGIGAMRAIELVQDQRRLEPYSALVDGVIGDARRRGLILSKAGVYGNVIRLLSPLWSPTNS